MDVNSPEVGFNYTVNPRDYGIGSETIVHPMTGEPLPTTGPWCVFLRYRTDWDGSYPEWARECASEDWDFPYIGSEFVSQLNDDAQTVKSIGSPITDLPYFERKSLELVKENSCGPSTVALSVNLRNLRLTHLSTGITSADVQAYASNRVDKVPLSDGRVGGSMPLIAGDQMLFKQLLMTERSVLVSMGFPQKDISAFMIYPRTLDGFVGDYLTEPTNLANLLDPTRQSAKEIQERLIHGDSIYLFNDYYGKGGPSHFVSLLAVDLGSDPFAIIYEPMQGKTYYMSLNQYDSKGNLNPTFNNRGMDVFAVGGISVTPDKHSISMSDLTLFPYQLGTQPSLSTSSEIYFSELPEYDRLSREYEQYVRALKKIAQPMPPSYDFMSIPKH
jgi:hypothetical protein